MAGSIHPGHGGPLRGWAVLPPTPRVAFDKAYSRWYNAGIPWRKRPEEGRFRLWGCAGR